MGESRRDERKKERGRYLETIREDHHQSNVFVVSANLINECLCFVKIPSDMDLLLLEYLKSSSVPEFELNINCMVKFRFEMNGIVHPQ